MKCEELDALFLGVLHLLQTCWHLNLRATIYQCNIGTQTFGCTARVHSSVTTTNHEHALGWIQWGIGGWVGCIHQVYTSQVLVT